MFKSRLRIPRASSLLRPSQSSAPSTTHQQRSIHATPARRLLQVPQAPEKFRTQGIENLFTPAGYNLAWTSYQTWLIDELNKLTAGTDHDGQTAKKIAIQTSREPSKANIFNYASMAHNNEFFFTGIASDVENNPSALVMPKDLQDQLELSFGSIDTLQREMILTANAMFGPGFVWLVKQTDSLLQRNAGQYRLLTTYLAGSPYPGAHWRRQNMDMNSVGGLTDQSGDAVRGYFDAQNHYNNRSPLHGSGSKFRDEERKKNPGGADLIPVLCVNTWQHVWLPDYGCGGKLDFLSNWWRLINWNRVYERAHPGPPGANAVRQVSPTINPLKLRKESQL